MPSHTKESDHDYANMDTANTSMANTGLNKRERAVDSAPSTPTKQPPEEKRTKPAEEGDGISNKTIFEAILGLEKKFEAQLEDIKEQNRQSAAMVTSLAKAVEFNAAEMVDCKKKVAKLETANEQLLKENDDLKNRVREQERYRMRWCLKLKGVKENKDENIRANVLQTLQKIAPDLKFDEAVDIVHRLGKRVDGRNRNVVVLFTQRRIKEELWKRTKDSPVCKQEGIKFAEMLPQEDLQDRQRLWPLIEEARRAGKRAYFRGPHAFIEGRKIEEKLEN
ncbi:hypothetical protein WMY93_008297 [Mugilogobius chulae]|uniref:L1 transposable element RRM domain-containing protein n=1 Tax=Mugilogobius chulae TaxID=88201 RepID=A0AAW0PS38_9GOBI